MTKSQRITNSSGAVTSTIDLDPWGGETNRSANSAFQPHKYTTYERDGNGGDDAMHRRYQSNWTRFSQPDPYDGSYDATNPQSFNRYSYVQNDPVNFVDPNGLNMEFAQPECQSLWEHVSRSMGMSIEEFSGWMSGCQRTGGGGGGVPVEPGGGGGGGQTPADVSKVKELLKNENCNKFLNAVLAALGTATGRGRDGATFGDLFQSADKGAAFHNDPSMYWALGDTSSLIGDPSLVIRINVGGDPYNIAVVAMHEIIHGAPRTGKWYSHFQMARAAYSVGDSMGLLSRLKNTSSKDKVPNPEEAKGIDTANSTLFQNILESACPRPAK